METELGGRLIWTGGNEERGDGCKEAEGRRAMDEVNETRA